MHTREGSYRRPGKSVVFTLPGCPSCQAELQWLTEKGLAFEDYDLQDVEIQEEVRSLEKRIQRHLAHTPITVINGEVYEGFDAAAFEALLMDED